MSNLPPDHQIGANMPPDGVDPFVQRLEGDTEDLLDLEADLELALSKVPKEVESDEGQGAVNAWVVKMRQLARDLEARRTDVKAPYLLREKQIDGFFGDVRTRVLQRAKEVEQRSTAYLQAKQRRAAAEAAAKAEAAVAERRAQEAAAAEARRMEQEAAAARRRAEEAIAAAARESAAASAKAERDLREAARAEAAAAKQVETADKGVRQAQLTQDRAERRAAAPDKLSRTGGGGANAAVVMIPRYRIDSLTKLLSSMGPINSFLDTKWLDGPLQRWAKIAQNDPKIREDIPGVEWFEEAETRTSATRT